MERVAPTAHVSVDLDPVDTHLAGYGIHCPPDDSIYRRAVPRILDLLDRCGIRATLFVVARDAARESRLWREACERGHEIASHSLTHPIPFARLPAAELWREVSESRRRLEEATGSAVIGFRAPGWDVDRTTLPLIARAGYRYDASLLPTPVLLAGAALRFLLSGGRMRQIDLRAVTRAAFAPSAPHLVDCGSANGGSELPGSSRLWEFPVAVSRRLRLPLTHTLWYLAPPALCRRALRGMSRAGKTLCYQFHAVDVLGLGEDDIDRRLARHPGMRWPRDRKIRLLEEVLAEIAARFRARTYAAAIAERDPHPPVETTAAH